MINKKIAFLTESGFFGKYDRNTENARVDVAWQIALNAIHYPLIQYKSVVEYDYVFVILPKGECTVNREGCEVTTKPKLLLKYILNTDFLNWLKTYNKHLCYVQEGPADYYLDYDLDVQLNFLNTLAEFDIIFCHNRYDIDWFGGLFREKQIEVLPSVMIEDTVKDYKFNLESISVRKNVMIGGNMSLWYSGLNSYILSKSILQEDIYCPTMHCKRKGEEQMVNILPYMSWNQWISKLSEFKYAVHLMPTVAAGTFSLNCAYLGIPCVGNYLLDTQNTCFPKTSVDVKNLKSASEILKLLKYDANFYEDVCLFAVEKYETEYRENIFVQKMQKILI